MRCSSIGSPTARSSTRLFTCFWRNPGLLRRMRRGLGGYPISGPKRCRGVDPRGDSRRRWPAGRPPPAGSPEEPPAAEPDATLTWSSREVLRKKDFEQMSTEEVEQAKAAVAAMRLPPAGGIDPAPAASTRAAGGSTCGLACAPLCGRGTGGIPLLYARRRTKPAPLVIVCDVSGSMSRYSRMLLHFVHAPERVPGSGSTPSSSARA